MQSSPEDRRSDRPGRPRVSLKLRVSLVLLGLALLVAQNIALFWLHYAQGYAIPWDFLRSYHALPYYWIEAMRHGVPVAWIPFQGMGYPIHINYQSGLFYPPFWIFVLLGQTYTVQAAVVLQGLHVLLGALGAVWCARLMGTRWGLALLAGGLYQCFGGFYSNASHPDIVRSFALLPWLCAPVFALWRPSLALAASIAVTPLAVYALCTGGYPGGVIAVLFTLALVVLARVMAAGRRWRAVLPIGAAITLALATGLLLAGVWLVPGFMERIELVRAAAPDAVSYDYLTLKDSLALAFAVDHPWFDHDITMRSIFVGLPVLALVFARPALGRARRAGPVLLAATLALAMATGWLHAPLAAWLPPLGYSRFPMADYRGFIGLALVLLAVQTLQLRSEGVTARGHLRYLWLPAVVGYVLLGLLTMAGAQPDPSQTASMVLLLALTASTLLWADRWAHRALAAPDGASLAAHPAHRRTAALLLAALALTTMLDWARVNWRARYFALAPGQAWPQAQLGSFEATRTALAARLTQPQAGRPARIELLEREPARIPWRGYYTGEYLMQDYSGPTKIARYRAVAQSPLLAEFARRPWTAVSLQPGLGVDAQALALAPPAPVTNIRYGSTVLDYEVDLPAPALVVENEMYWNGWSARAGDTQLAAVNVQGFRAWQLPQGRYRMSSRFTPPYLASGLIASLLGLALWALLAWAIAARLRRSPRRP